MLMFSLKLFTIWESFSILSVLSGIPSPALVSFLFIPRSDYLFHLRYSDSGLQFAIVFKLYCSWTIFHIIRLLYDGMALEICFFFVLFFAILQTFFPCLMLPYAIPVHLYLILFLMLPPPPSLLLSLCILDHFLSFQVSRPVEADYPSSRGRSTPYCLGGVSVSICSRYAHSPDPLCLGGWDWGTGWPPAHCGRHLLQ